MAGLLALPGLLFGSGGGAAAAGAGISGAQALSAIGTTAGLVGTIGSGVVADRAARQQALNDEAAGKEELAASQRDAQQRRREGALLASRQQALAAASGGGADDPTIVKLMTDAASASDLNARSSLYGGISRQMGFNSTARARRAEGKASLLGNVLGGFGNAATGYGKAFG